MSRLPGSNRLPFGYKPNALPLSQGGKLGNLTTIFSGSNIMQTLWPSILASAFRGPEAILIYDILLHQGEEEGNRRMQRLHARPMLTSAVSRASEIRGAQ